MSGLSGELRVMLSTAAHLPTDAIAPGRGFAEQGIGASQLAAFAEAVRHRFGREIPNLLWECPSLASLAAHLSAPPENAGDQDRAAMFRSIGFSSGLPDEAYYD